MTMNQFAKIATILTSAAIFSGCASGPNLQEMRKLNGDEVTELLAGKTLTANTDYGRWTQTYSAEDLSGNGKASGDFGAEVASSTVTVAEGGEICSQFSAKHDWSKPEHRYCSEFYAASDGSYAIKATVNTRRQERVGKVRKAEIKDGDPYGLNES